MTFIISNLDFQFNKQYPKYLFKMDKSLMFWLSHRLSSQCQRPCNYADRLSIGQLIHTFCKNFLKSFGSEIRCPSDPKWAYKRGRALVDFFRNCLDIISVVIRGEFSNFPVPPPWPCGNIVIWPIYYDLKYFGRRCNLSWWLYAPSKN